MKKINIFLAVNEQDLNNEKIEISNFIKDLNDKLENYNIYLKLITDDFSNEIDEKNIENSELFLIVLDNKVGNRVLNEFNIAYKKFTKDNMPKISTYIRKTDLSMDESLLSFIKHLDEELGHYYNQYENMDTIKLNIILSLKALELGIEKIEIKDEKLCIDSEEIITLENIPMIFNSKNLNELKEQLRKIEEDYYKAKEKLDFNQSEECFEEYINLKEERKKIKDSIYTLEQNIIELEFSFLNSTMRDKISRRQMYAKKCLEQGNLEEAKNVLNLETLKQEAKNLISIKGSRMKELRVIADELMQLANTLKLDTNNLDRFNRIEEAYEEAIKIENQVGMERRAVLEYAEYLCGQRQYLKAIEKFEYYFNYKKLIGEFKANLDYCILAKCYAETSQFELAEEVYISCIEYYENLIADGENSNFNKYILVKTYISLAIEVYEITNRYQEAENLMLKSLELTEELVELVPEKYKELLGNTYGSIAMLYAKTDRYEEAAILYEKSIEIKEEQKKNEFELKSLATTYNNYAYVLDLVGKYEEAKEIFHKAIDEYVNLSKENPEAYQNGLAISYSNLARIEQHLENYELAEKYYLNAIELQEKIILQDLDMDKKSLATTYSNIASLYGIQNKNTDEIKYFKKASEIFEELFEKNEIVFGENLGLIYSQLATALVNNYDYENGKKYFNKSLQILEMLAEDNYAAVCNSLAFVYNSLGIFYYEIYQLSEAEKYLKKSIEINEKLSIKNKEYYEKDLEIAYNNLKDLQEDLKKSPEILELEFEERANQYIEYAVMCMINKEFEEMEAAYIQAANLYQELLTNNSENDYYLKMLASVYDKIAESKYVFKEYDQYKIFALKAINVFEKLQENGVESREKLLNLYKNICEVYEKQSDYENEEIYFKKYIKLFEEKTEDKFELAKQYNTLGLILKENGKYNQAETYFINSAEILENNYSSKATDDLEIIYSNLISIYELLRRAYQRLEEYDEMKVYYEKSILVQERLVKINSSKYEKDLAILYNNYANVLYDINLLKEAEIQFLKVINFLKKLIEAGSNQYKHNLAIEYYNISCLYNDLKELDNQEKYDELAIQLYEEIDEEEINKENIISKGKLSYLYCDYAIIKEGKKEIGEAEKYYLKDVNISEKVFLFDREFGREDLSNAYKNLIKFYTKIEEFNKAEEIKNKLEHMEE